MCTGSGCLAILLAHAYPDADIDAVDISSDALAVAQRNVSDYGLADRINLIRSDLFANLPEKSYDLIISNPPYVTAMAMETLPPEYRHEPELALAGGDDGLDAVRALIKEAPRFLNPGGTLVVEIGHNRAAAETAFPRLPFVWLATAVVRRRRVPRQARRPDRWPLDRAMNLHERPGGEILVASLRRAGRHARVRRARRKLSSRCSTRCTTCATACSFIVCRQEGGAAYMAEAYGKLTGTPGLAFVTRGPGASNAAIGIHTAQQDSTPMIVFVGQVGGDMVDREAFQEVDYRRMYGSVAKWAAQIDRAERIPEYVAHAYRLAMSGRPGPVVLALPEDMLTSRATCADAPRVDGGARGARRRTTIARRARRLARRARAAGARRRQPLGRGRLRRACRVRRGARAAGRRRVPPPGPVRQPRIRTTPATSASASIRSSPRACATPTCCW